MKTVSIIIPVYNEDAYIKRCLENTVNKPLPNWKKEIIVINDGSTDKTKNILSEMQAHNFPMKVVHSKINKGKGNSIKEGLKISSGDIIIVQDGDLEYDPSDYPVILDTYSKPGTNVVYGSRILGAKLFHTYSSNMFFYYGGILLTSIVNVLFNTQLTDQSTGYKTWKSSFNQGVISHCTSNGFEFEIELTAYLASVTQIKEVPIHYYPRAINHGKKITIVDFFKSVITAIKSRPMISNNSSF